ncbi:methyl-accepting chemotaxis protein [Noviherbaspirillum agri]
MLSLQRIHALSISRRLGILMACAILGVFALTALFLYSEEQLIMEERKSSVRQTVEVAHNIAVHYQGLAAKGVMPEEDAKRAAMDAIRALRYSGNEYFWINDSLPTMIMHPIKPEMEGKDLRANTDPTGKHLFVEFVKMAKANGAGFVPYMWPKPGSADPVEKVSYVKAFPQWDWIIGSGVYVDTVRATILARLVNYGLSALALAAALFLISLVIARGMLRQLGGEPTYAASITHRIADGDLTAKIDLKNNDTSSLLHALKTMSEGITQIISQVRTGTDNIVTASREIATGNQDLSARTEHQASSLEETASSMEELTSTVKQNADNARQANQLAVTASSIAVKGGDVVAQVVQTMGSINDSSKKIVDIISVIDGIAFQTNILALNAAVEAARAGEQGRGFAVVASEVRNLAQRSAAAAKEIKTLIGDSVEKVDAGSKLVTEAGTTMDEIVNSVKRVTDIMAEIMAASQEQSSGIEQVNQAIIQMDQVTQQNAALVEQAAAAAQSLQDEATRLAQEVSRFKLDMMQSAVMPSRSAAPARTTAPLAQQAKPVRPAVTATTGKTRQVTVTPPARLAKPTNDEADWEEF